MNDQQQPELTIIEDHTARTCERCRHCGAEVRGQGIRSYVHLTQQAFEQCPVGVADVEDALKAKLNAPELFSFRDAVVLEAAHQRERWGSEHDDGKKPSDWFWLVGYLAGKALASAIAGDTAKALHHTISAAAVLANWHAAILGKTNMRPGIMTPKESNGT